MKFKKALPMIKIFEGLRLASYKCHPSEKMYTIGYGHYGVKNYLTITEPEAEAYLIKDMCSAEKAVNKYQKIYNFNQNQYDALISFAFNLGSITQLTNKGKRTIEEISRAMVFYVKTGGVTLQGLVDRRKIEQTLFNTPVAVDKEVAVISKSASQLAKEVIAGKWGNGVERIERLEAAGYNYLEVQKYVNKLLK